MSNYNEKQSDERMKAIGQNGNTGKHYEEENINDCILKWAKDRNLLKYENSNKQIIKLMEETGELSSAYLKNNREELEDAIGDIGIVMIILSNQLGLDFEYSIKKAYDVIKNRTGQTINGTFIKD